MQKTKLIVTRVKDGSFEGSGGEQIEYYWIKGVREDGVTVEFGTKNKYEEGDDLDIYLEKTETPRGFRYKEIN